MQSARCCAGCAIRPRKRDDWHRTAGAEGEDAEYHSPRGIIVGTMRATILAICAGAAFGLWSLVMSLTGLRGGGLAFVYLAATTLVITPWFLLRPEPWIAPGRPAWIAVAAGLGAASLNGVGMVLLPTLLDAPPAVVGTRMLILNMTVVSLVAVWSVSFGWETLTGSKIAGLVLAVVAVWLLGR